MKARKPSPPAPDPGAAIAEVKAIYRELDQRPVERSCINRADCCHFQRTGRTPYLTRGEAIVAARAWRAAGRTALPAQGPDGACPFLANNRCLIHQDRPFGCRTHFCAAAGGPLARAEVRDLIQRLETIDTSLGGDGAINLPQAVRMALENPNRPGKRPR